MDAMSRGRVRGVAAKGVATDRSHFVSPARRFAPAIRPLPKNSEAPRMAPQRPLDLVIALSLVAVSAVSAHAQVTSLPTETPAKLTPTYAGFDHVRRDVMMPMRDGVKLH